MNNNNFNLDIDIFKRNVGEQSKDYVERICRLKDEYDLSYSDLAQIVSQYADRPYSKDGVRKLYNKRVYGNYTKEFKPVDEEELKNKFKYQDLKTQLNAAYRKLSREDTIREIAREYASIMNQRLDLEHGKAKKGLEYVREGILLLSDWHYGVSFNNYWGTFNPEIVKKRLNDLFFDIQHYIKIYGLKKLNILNLGDLIAGRIHLRIRLNSRIDTITQIMDVSELLAQFMAKLSNIVEIIYYSCNDNHSRIEPNKNDSLDLESLTRITDWYLKERLPSIKVIDNKYDDDIITFDCLGYKVAAVHGHRDKQNVVVSNLSLMTKTHYDLICTAHEHHFSCDEKNETIVVSNPSLMGTDDYAKDLRLCASPAQTLIISSEDNIIESIHRIKLN